jgi:hypothetical protein
MNRWQKLLQQSTTKEIFSYISKSLPSFCLQTQLLVQLIPILYVISRSFDSAQFKIYLI